MTQILIHILLTVLLLLSFGGYMSLARRIGLDWAFVPIFVLSSLALVIYLAGLAGFLFPGAIVVLSGGLLAFAHRLWLHLAGRHRFALPKITFFRFGFIVVAALFALLLAQSRLVHYDNFSHWAIVLKEMLVSNSIPTAESSLIDFKNYPLGIASFLYYVCRFAGHSEQIMICAQGALIFASFFAIFGIIAEKKRFLLYIFLALGLMSLSLFNQAVRINDLLVDFLLPVFTLALFAIAYRYRSDPKLATIATIPLAGLLVITKSTGIVFAAFALIFLAQSLIRHRAGRHLWRVLATLVLAVAGSLAPYFLWTLHQRTRFADVDNKFDLSANPGSKTPSEIAEITQLFLQEVFNLSTRAAMGMLAFTVAAVVVSLYVGLVRRARWNLWKVLITMLLVVAAYYAGILALYIYSMPMDEAAYLAGFERYASSIVILFVGALVMATTIDIEGSFHVRVGTGSTETAFLSPTTKKRYQQSVAICIAAFSILTLSEFNGMLYNLRNYPESLPAQVQDVTGDRWPTNGKEDPSKYLMYASDKYGQVTNYYLQYLGRYYLYAPHVDGTVLFWEDNMDNLLSEYDYLVMVEPDADSERLMQKHYGVSGEPGIYRVRQLADGQVSLSLQSASA